MRLRCLKPVKLAAGQEDSPAGFVFDPARVGMAEDEIAVNVERGILVLVDDPPDAEPGPAKSKKGGKS